jgi:uncharacterized membrane protein
MLPTLLQLVSRVLISLGIAWGVTGLIGTASFAYDAPNAGLTLPVEIASVPSSQLLSIAFGNSLELVQKTSILSLVAGAGYLAIQFLNTNNLVSFHVASVQRYQKYLHPVAWSWKTLIIAILVLRVFFSVAPLDQQPFNADEVRGFYRISGYTRSQVVEAVFNGEVVDAKQLQYYQQPHAERSLSDTITALAGNPEHTPLYYLLARFWMQWFGEPSSARLLSIFFGLAAIPAMYWLCLELFQSTLAAWLGMGLLAISPHQILIALGARQYSLWTLVTLVSGAMLLRALRSPTRKNWLIYAGTLVIGLYSHLFFVLTAIAQFAYTLLSTSNWRKHLKPLLASFSIGIGAFLPWILVVATNISTIQEKTKWVSNYNSSLSSIIQGTITNIGDMFWDWNTSYSRLEKYGHYGILLLVILSLYCLIRFTPKRIWLFIVLPIAITLLPLIVADLTLGGGRSLQTRYVLPAMMSCQFAVLYFLTNAIVQSQHRWERYVWRAGLVGLLTTGVISGGILLNNPGWDYLKQGNTANALNVQLAPFINAAPRPIVLSSATHSFVLGLSHLVNDNVKFQLWQGTEAENWAKTLNIAMLKQQYSDVFVYYPSKEFSAFLTKTSNQALVPVFGYQLMKL